MLARGFIFLVVGLLVLFISSKEMKASIKTDDKDIARVLEKNAKIKKWLGFLMLILSAFNFIAFVAI